MLIYDVNSNLPLSIPYNEMFNAFLCGLPFFVNPNPANDVLNINLGEFTYGQRQLLGVKIELIDMHGRVIQLVKYDYESHTASVDISHFSPGVYLVRVSGEGYSSSERFVVSK